VIYVPLLGTNRVFEFLSLKGFYFVHVCVFACEKCCKRRMKVLEDLNVLKKRNVPGVVTKAVFYSFFVVVETVICKGEDKYGVTEFLFNKKNFVDAKWGGGMFVLCVSTNPSII